MANWRARRYSITIHRRKATITLRRFRLAKKAKPSATRKQYLLNIHVGKLKQVSFEYTHPKKSAIRSSRVRQVQAVLASLLILCGLGGIAFSAVALSRSDEIAPPKTFTAQPRPQRQAKLVAAKPKVLSKSTPTHITIASQQIDVDLIPVGLAADGSIELPPVLDWVAGWYKYSPTPGELGPAVIVGHVDSYEGTSVFWRLRDVQAGDLVDIQREDGTVAHFKITQLAQYDQNNFPTDEVYGNTDNAALRVITCSGVFDETTQHYTQNTVVYGELVS